MWTISICTYLDGPRVVLWDGFRLNVDFKLSIKVLLNKGLQVVNTEKKGCNYKILHIKKC